MKKEKKLTKAELKRKEQFETVSAELEAEGYTKNEQTIGLVYANFMAIIAMLPFVAALVGSYYCVNNNVIPELSPVSLIAYFPLCLVLTVVHELIHGITWGAFAENHFKSISFGVMWQMLTPYCSCNEPLKRWQYMLGGAMPTIVLGTVLGISSIALGNFLLLILAVVMIFGGGGDFLIFLKLIFYKSKGKDVIFYDHPFECGFVAFEKEK